MSSSPILIGKAKFISKTKKCNTCCVSHALQVFLTCTAISNSPKFEEISCHGRSTTTGSRPLITARRHSSRGQIFGSNGSGLFWNALVNIRRVELLPQSTIMAGKKPVNLSRNACRMVIEKYDAIPLAIFSSKQGSSLWDWHIGTTTVPRIHIISSWLGQSRRHCCAMTQSL